VFTLRRLSRLGARQRLAKAARILQAAEESLQRERAVDRGYLRELAELVAGWTDGPAAEAARALAAAAAGLAGRPSMAQGRPSDIPVTADLGSSMAQADLLRMANGLRHALLAEQGAEPSEWDLLQPDGELDRSNVRIRPITVYLEDLRSPFNVGSIFRTAEAFGVSRLVLSPRTPLPTHPRAERTARGAGRAVPWEVRELADLDSPGGIFALELGGRDIGTFPFPPTGMVLVGSEELGLSPEALRLAEASLGRVSVPLAGAKRSLNVSVAFGILMHRWYEALERDDG
jgi:TrmH family RNA methyltransferase